jgi:hypothetical protein
MQRTYRPWLGLALAAGASLLPLAASGQTAGLFSSRPLDASRFAVLGKPVGRSDWTLLVLEQVQPAPRCWEQRADGLIDPALNRFDFSGICSRYIDSNGYSLRIGQRDLASTYRLRLQQRGTTLELLAMTPSDPATLLVGLGRVDQRDRDGFVMIQLQPGWQLQRRVFGEQTLSHVYFAHATPLSQLLAANGATPTRSIAQLLPSSPSNPLSPSRPAAMAQGPVALQVIPFRN